MNKKILKINEDSHKKIIDFCEKNGLVMYKWVEKILLEEINKQENGNGNDK